MLIINRLSFSNQNMMQSIIYNSTGSTTTSGSEISQSRITDSSIDMSGRFIDNVQDPLLPQQSATKKYVDDMSICNVSQSVSLQSTTPVVIATPRYGSFTITIQGPSDRSPTGIFVVSKPNFQVTATRIVLANSPGCYMMDQPPTYLLLYWEMNQPMMLSKNNDAFDGIYKVFVSPTM